MLQQVTFQLLTFDLQRRVRRVILLSEAASLFEGAGCAVSLIGAVS